MFEKFSSELQKIAARIKSTFELIESFQKKSTATVDIYSKVNRTLFEKKFKQYFKPPYSPQPGAKQ
jgi:hypothetical protein